MADCLWLGAWCAILSLAVAALRGVRQMNTPKHLRWILLVICSSTTSQAALILEWCECGTGLNNFQIWPDNDQTQAVTIKSGNQTQTLRWANSTKTVHWRCDGDTTVGSTTLTQSSANWVCNPPRACLSVHHRIPRTVRSYCHPCDCLLDLIASAVTATD